MTIDLRIHASQYPALSFMLLRGLDAVDADHQNFSREIVEKIEEQATTQMAARAALDH